MLSQVADRFAHMLWTGRAVQANEIDLQSFQDRQCCGDIGAQEHAPCGIQGDLDLKRQVDAALFKGLVYTRQRQP